MLRGRTGIPVETNFTGWVGTFEKSYETGRTGRPEKAHRTGRDILDISRDGTGRPPRKISRGGTFPSRDREKVPSRENLCFFWVAVECFPGGWDENRRYCAICSTTAAHSSLRYLLSLLAVLLLELLLKHLALLPCNTLYAHLLKLV